MTIQRGEIYFVDLNPVQFPLTPAGKLSDHVLEQVEHAVRYCLGL